jgi:hypothetical protein
MLKKHILKSASNGPPSRVQPSGTVGQEKSASRNRPILPRKHWFYMEYDDFVVLTSNLPRLLYEPWVPAAVAEEFNKLYAESVSDDKSIKARELLDRLAFDPRMKRVWQELYKMKRVKHKSTEQFLHPICVTHYSMADLLRRRAATLSEGTPEEKMLERAYLAEAKFHEKQTFDPLTNTRWTEQDLGVQRFLWRIYHSDKKIEPIFLSEIKAEVAALRQAAERLRAEVATLQSLGIRCDGLEQIASECDAAARTRDRDPKVEDPWIITRKRGDPICRTLVVDIAGTTEGNLGTALNGIIAIIANVCLDRADLTGTKVRDMLRMT